MLKLNVLQCNSHALNLQHLQMDYVNKTNSDKNFQLVNLEVAISKTINWHSNAVDW